MYAFFEIAFGIFLVVIGICDICKRKIRWGYSSKMKSKERQLWQRWVGVVELVLGVCDILYFPFAKMQRVTSVFFAVLVITSVCILGPYYHWRHEHKDDPDD